MRSNVAGASTSSWRGWNGGISQSWGSAVTIRWADEEGHGVVA